MYYNDQGMDFWKNQGKRNKKRSKYDVANILTGGILITALIDKKIKKNCESGPPYQSMKLL